MNTNTNTHCPCGSNKLYTACCELFISGKQLPPTPEALMRSRYTAFTQANVDYIASTMQGEAAKQFNPEQTREWSKHVSWIGLQILDAPPVTDTENKGTVEFIAQYRWQNKIDSIHERSEFHCKNGRWYYIDGHEPKRTAASKIGRNDPCSCNSGKKYKKCCDKNPLPLDGGGLGRG